MTMPISLSMAMSSSLEAPSPSMATASQVPTKFAEASPPPPLEHPEAPKTLAMTAILVATMPLVLSFLLVGLAKSRAHLQSGSQEWVPEAVPHGPKIAARCDWISKIGP